MGHHHTLNNSYLTAQAMQQRPSNGGPESNLPPKQLKIRTSISNFRKKILFQKGSSAESNNVHAY